MPQPIIESKDTSDDFNIDDLVPADMKNAYEETHKDESEDDSLLLNNDSDVDEESTEETQAKEEEIDESSLDFSTDAIEKLMSGDTSALLKNKSEDDEDSSEELPAWREEDEYKNLVENYYNLDVNLLDSLIKKVTDSKAIENKEYVNQLKASEETLKNKENLYIQEINRLRGIEKNAMFDNTKYAKEKYTGPMGTAKAEIDRFLKLEGVKIPVEDILKAANKVERTKLLEDYVISDDIAQKIDSHWTTYKNLEYDYNRDKESAQSDLAKSLGNKISEEKVSEVFGNSVSELMSKEESYKYIKEALGDEIMADGDAKDVLVTARNNFKSITNAISNSYEYSRDSEFLANLAKFSIEAAHQGLLAEKYTTLEKKYAETEGNLKKVVIQYKKLLESGKGTIGKNNSVVFSKNNKSNTKSDADTAKEFADLLANKISIDQIL